MSKSSLQPTLPLFAKLGWVLFIVGSFLVIHYARTSSYEDSHINSFLVIIPVLLGGISSALALRSGLLYNPKMPKSERLAWGVVIGFPAVVVGFSSIIFLIIAALP